MKWYKVGAAVALVTLWLTAASVAAWAGNWLGFTAGGNNTVEFDECSLTTQMHTAFHSNDNHDIAPTAITSVGYHRCDQSEVQVRDASYGTNDPPGWWHCHVWGPAGICSYGEVHLNLSYSYTVNSALHLVCQEIGHSVGLDHPTSGLSCMREAMWSNLHLIQHDINLINANYNY